MGVSDGLFGGLLGGLLATGNVGLLGGVEMREPDCELPRVDAGAEDGGE